MNRTGIVLFLIFLVIGANAQTISIEKTFGGDKYIQDGKKLTMKELSNRLEVNPKAFQLIKKAKSNYGVAQVLGAVGGFMIGWPLGTAIGGGDPNWALAGIGLGIVVITIPISSNSRKQAKSAISIYNQDILQSSRNFNPRFNLSLTGHGFGVVMNF